MKLVLGSVICRKKEVHYVTRKLTHYENIMYSKIGNKAVILCLSAKFNTWQYFLRF